MQASREKSVALLVILLLTFGVIGCCGTSLLLAAVGRNEELEHARAADLEAEGELDAGEAAADLEDDSEADDDAFAEAKVQAERDAFATQLTAAFASAGHPLEWSEDEEVFLDAEGTRVDLDRWFPRFQALPQEQRGAFLQRLVATIYPPALPASWAEGKERLAVLVLPASEEQALEGEPPLARPLADGLTELLVAEPVADGAPRPLEPRVLTRQAVAAWGQPDDALFAQGRQRLAAKKKVAFERVAPGVYQSRWEDELALGRLAILPKLGHLPVRGAPIFFLPNRSTLLLIGEGDRQAQDALEEVLEDALDAPDAMSGQGWRFNGATFTRWSAPAGTGLAQLELEGRAREANLQKAALEARSEREGTDVFVASVLLAEDDEGLEHGFAVWSRGVDSLLPEAEFIVFVDPQRPEGDQVVAAAPWKTVLARFPERLEQVPSLAPARWRAREWPAARAVRQLGIVPLFAKGEDAADDAP